MEPYLDKRVEGILDELQEHFGLDRETVRPYVEKHLVRTGPKTFDWSNIDPDYEDPLDPDDEPFDFNAIPSVDLIPEPIKPWIKARRLNLERSASKSLTTEEKETYDRTARHVAKKILKERQNMPKPVKYPKYKSDFDPRPKWGELGAMHDPPEVILSPEERARITAEYHKDHQKALHETREIQKGIQNYQQFHALRTKKP